MLEYKLDLNLHRYHILLSGHAKFFFTNVKLVVDTLISNGRIRRSNDVEVIDNLTGKTIMDNETVAGICRRRLIN